MSELEVAGRRLAIRNLDRVIFPRTGTTKAQLLDYYVHIADAMLPHLRERLSRMAKGVRAGKVLFDWSQNTEHKSTVCAYSVRAKARPTVSTPVAWEEVAAAVAAQDASLLVFEMDDVRRRGEEHGDLSAPVLSGERGLDRR